jgi:MYXO-CTERM domain-containing protein
MGKVPLCAAGLAALATGAAAMADISETVFVIQATNANGTATYVADFNQGRMDHAGTYQWQLPQSMALRSDSGVPIAMLNQAVIVGHNDPSVNLSFNVFSGAIETTFTITSATVSFASITGAEGRTSASVSITDLNGDGVTMHNSGGNPGAFSAFYNGAPPGGTVFHDLFSSPITTPIAGNTMTSAEDFPGGGSFANISGAVTSISSRFQFTLSPNDMASGTSVFTVQQVPTPGAMALLGLGGLIAARRRHR